MGAIIDQFVGSILEIVFDFLDQLFAFLSNLFGDMALK